MDEFGRKELLCMCCGKKIAGRVERESEKFRGKTSFDFMKFADYREIPFFLKDGSVAFLIFCDEHKNVEPQTDKLTDQLFRARVMELSNSGKTQGFIDNVMVNFKNKAVVRRMTGEEAREKFSQELLESKAR
jgi:hypothetical protein